MNDCVFVGRRNRSRNRGERKKVSFEGELDPKNKEWEMSPHRPVELPSGCEKSSRESALTLLLSPLGPQAVTKHFEGGRDIGGGRERERGDMGN
jgi:hypothetical protein